MPSYKRKFGNRGELIAESFLLERGYKVLERNYRVKNLGEIDLIAKKGDRMCFIEVKTRSGGHETSFPIEFSINPKKRINLKRICQLYLLDKQMPPNQAWQVDAVFVRFNSASQDYKVDLLENIVWDRYY